MNTSSEVNTQKLVADLKVVIADAEDLLRATAGQAGEKLAAARERAQASLAVARAKLGEAERMVLERSRQAAHATDEYVHDNPWTAVGIAAGVGLVIGLLIGRR
jgi:ElaB/YqjD/DUF883 family membrane-anchored ribosome-binding protein